MYNVTVFKYQESFDLTFYTAISKQVVVVNSQYWNRKELWVQS